MRLALAFALAAAVSWAAPPAALGAGHAVVLRDGQLLHARTQPVMALGRVTFVNAQGRQQSLPASAVDLEATRRRIEAAEGPRVRPRVWDLESLRQVGGAIQWTGPAGGDARRTDARQEPTLEERAVLIRKQIFDLDRQLESLGEGHRAVAELGARRLRLQRQLHAVLAPRPEPPPEELDFGRPGVVVAAR